MGKRNSSVQKIERTSLSIVNASPVSALLGSKNKRRMRGKPFTPFNMKSLLEPKAKGKPRLNRISVAGGMRPGQEGERHSLKKKNIPHQERQESRKNFRVRIPLPASSAQNQAAYGEGPQWIFTDQSACDKRFIPLVLMSFR